MPCCELMLTILPRSPLGREGAGVQQHQQQQQQQQQQQ